MSPEPRYAIYHVPAHDSVFYRRAAALLGYDAYDGETPPVPMSILQAAPDWHEVTRDPRKYGFHATLKAPFVLAPDHVEADLVDAVAGFARGPRAVPVITPVVKSISDFIAVVPAARSAALERLAQDCVDAFEPFRAPMTAEDRARRKPHLLTPRQVGYLDRWGYPYVMDDFRFHMTLTGRLPAARHDALIPILRQLVPFDADKLPIDRIALCKQQTREAAFRVLASHILTPSAPGS